MRALPCAALLLVLLLLSACRPDPPLVKIGLVAPFEGRHRDVGYDAIYAARLAVRELNGRAARGAWRVELVALDDSADAQLGRQAAASLLVDPAVIAVVGHWREETTAAAAPLYAQEHLPFVALGRPPFERFDPDALPAAFLEAYAAVTPFDEVAGPYAAPTYDAFWLLFTALEVAETEGQISRESVAAALEGLQYQGLTGTVSRP